MLVRMLGKEAEALENGGEHPFTDVPDVGYACENKPKNESKTLGEKLVDMGAYTKEAFENHYDLSVLKKTGSRLKKSSL